MKTRLDLTKRLSVYTIENCINNSQTLHEFNLNYGKITRRNLRKVEYITRNAAGEYLWHCFRRHCVSGTLSKVFVRDMERGSLSERVRKGVRKLYIRDLSHIPAIRFGLRKENVARKLLLKHWRKFHPRASIRQYGIQYSAPMMSYSVDGILRNEGGETFLVEIKTAPSLERKKIKNRREKLPYLNKQGRLRKTHKHMFQIQYYLWCTKLYKCIFFIYARRDFSLEIVERDEELFDRFESMQNFYLKEYIEPRYC